MGPDHGFLLKSASGGFPGDYGNLENPPINVHVSCNERKSIEGSSICCLNVIRFDRTTEVRQQITAFTELTNRKEYYLRGLIE